MREVIKKASGLAVVLLLASMLFSACGIVGTGPRGVDYVVKLQIQDAVTKWMMSHNGERPYSTAYYNITTKAGTTVNNCSVIDICSIVGTGLLKKVPDGCYGNASITNSNFYNASAYTGCTNPNDGTGHYVWVIDLAGNIYSICDENQDGIYSDADRVDGFHQDIWP